MKSSSFAIRTLALLLGAMVCLAAYRLIAEDVAENSDDARSEVLAANEQFYTALNEMFVGNPALMESVWSHTDEIVYLSPTGEQFNGWEAVRKSWLIQANYKLGGNVEANNVQYVMLSPTLALVTNREVGENPNTPHGPMKVNIRSSKIFRLEEGEWKLFFDHVDLLPLLASKAA